MPIRSMDQAEGRGNCERRGKEQRTRELGEKGQGQRARELRKKSGDWEKGRGNWENCGESCRETTVIER